MSTVLSSHTRPARRIALFLALVLLLRLSLVTLIIDKALAHSPLPSETSPFPPPSGTEADVRARARTRWYAQDVPSGG